MGFLYSYVNLILERFKKKPIFLISFLDRDVNNISYLRQRGKVKSKERNT